MIYIIYIYHIHTHFMYHIGYVHLMLAFDVGSMAPELSRWPHQAPCPARHHFPAGRAERPWRLLPELAGGRADAGRTGGQECSGRSTAGGWPAGWLGWVGKWGLFILFSWNCWEGSLWRSIWGVSHVFAMERPQESPCAGGDAHGAGHSADDERSEWWKGGASSGFGRLEKRAILCLGCGTDPSVHNIYILLYYIYTYHILHKIYT